MRKTQNTHLTERFVKTLLAPASGNKITKDDEVIGFGFRVTCQGARSFILNYVVHGRERRMTIGSYPAWTVLAAREQAKKLRQQVDQGIDPLEIKEAERLSMNVKELWKEYKKRHVPNLSDRAQKDVASMFDRYILPALGSKRLKDLTGADIDNLHSNITELGGSTRANRVLEVLRGMINKGIRWGFCETNPANGFRRNAEEPKENYLTPQQLSVVFVKLAKMENKKAANVIRMLIFTGARLGEVLRAEWSQFDLPKGVWTKPSSHTKQKRQHVVPIAPEVIELLKEMSKDPDDKIYLFPSEVGKPMHDIKKPWTWLQKEAKIPGTRLHDLRHTYASLLISSGQSLSVIGKLLGHSQHQTTMRYAHLSDDPLRRATSLISGMISQSTP